MSTEIRADFDVSNKPHVMLADVPDALPVSTVNSLKLAARKSFSEVCGFITNRYDIVYVKNSHPEPDANFIMDAIDYKRAIEQIYVGEDKIIGVFHTHPGGSPHPSMNDIKGWPNEQLGWRYLIATPDEVYEYQYKNQPANHGMWSGIPVQ